MAARADTVMTSHRGPIIRSPIGSPLRTSASCAPCGKIKYSPPLPCALPVASKQYTSLSLAPTQGPIHHARHMHPPASSCIHDVQRLCNRRGAEGTAPLSLSPLARLKPSSQKTAPQRTHLAPKGGNQAPFALSRRDRSPCTSFKEAHGPQIAAGPLISLPFSRAP